MGREEKIARSARRGFGDEGEGNEGIIKLRLEGYGGPRNTVAAVCREHKNAWEYVA